MTELEKLLARQAEISKRLAEIGGGEDELTDETRAEIDTLGDELRSNEQTIDKIKADERRRKLVEESRAKWGSTQVQPATTDIHDLDLRRADIASTELRSRVARVMDDNESVSHLNDEQRNRVNDLIRRSNRNVQGDLISRLLLATENPHYRSAFQKYTAGSGDLLTSEEARAVEQVRTIKRAMSIGTPAAGGYAVPVLLDPTIVWTSQGSSNPIMGLARVETITNDKWKGLTSDGMTWQFNAEAAETTDNSPTLDDPEVPVHRADGFIPFSIEVDMDWPSFASDMSTAIARGYREKLAEVLAVGTGANTPVGVVSRLAATTTAVVPTATAGTIAPADIYGLWKALPERHRGADSTAWLSSVGVENAIRQFGTTDPNFTANITEDGIGRLFAKRYPTTDYMSDTVAGTTAGNLLVVGNWRGFLVAQRAGMNVELVSHLMGSNRRPTGQRGFFAWARVGSDVIDPTALKLLQNKTSA